MKTVVQYEVGDTGKINGRPCEITDVDYPDAGMEIRARFLDESKGAGWFPHGEFQIDAPADPVEVAFGAVDPGWQKQHARQTALAHAVDLAKNEGEGYGYALAAAKAFEDYLRG